jgi:hypothetical protein
MSDMATNIKKRMVIAIGALIGVIALLALFLGVVLPAQAAPQTHHPTECRNYKSIERWTNVEQLKAKGFFVDVIGEQASLGFEREYLYKFLTLDVDVTPQDFAGQYIASRITEVDTSLPVDQRVKCWQPTAHKDLVVEFTVRFDQTVSPMLTENLMLWNAPLGESPIPMTAFGVSRSVMSNYQYAAVFVQDLNYADFSSSLFQVIPMPEWLDVTKWHRVRITISEDTALIEVAQGRHRYTSVSGDPVILSHPPEKLSFEFSVDNEMLPGTYVPVAAPDSLDVGSLEISLTHGR